MADASDAPGQPVTLPHKMTEKEGTRVLLTRQLPAAAEDVALPAKISGKTITAIGERAFYDNRTVKSVTISDGSC